MDQQVDNHATEEKLSIDRTKLKEERKIRNKQKKATKKLEKQKDREQKELLLKLQPKSANVTLITRDFADKVVGSTGITSYKNESINTADFPELTSAGSRIVKRYTLPTLFVETNNDKKKLSKLELSDFLCAPSTSAKPSKSSLSASIAEGYSGNPLDSDMPIRRRGKHREIPKPKHHSKLKQNILSERNDCEKFDVIIDSCLLSETELCDNVITKELDDAVEVFISDIVGFQERLYNRDPIKGVAKRRYVVGLHEARKYLKLNKAKMVIVAPDIKLTKCDGALFRTIKEIIDLINANNIHYVFALKRKLLGTLTLKHIPVSCVVILNYEGLEEQLKNILEVLPSVRKEEKCVKLESDENDANFKFLNNLMEALKSK